jgi:hypothetical protein
MKNSMIMKNILKIAALCVTISTLALSSCIKDNTDGNNNGVKDGIPVTIRLNAATRATVEGDPADNVITSLRALIYDSKTGELQYNIPVTLPTPTRLNIKTGTFDFVYIANEGSDTALAAMFASADESAFNTLTKLKTLSFAATAFDSAKNIPMARHYRSVRVTGDDALTYTDPSDGTNATVANATWNVPLERIAIRLKFNITLTENQYLDWYSGAGAGGFTGVVIYNFPLIAYIEPGIENADYVKGRGLGFEAAENPGTDVPGKIVVNGDGTATVTYNRIIMPELILSSANNLESNALLLTMYFGTLANGNFVTKTGIIKIPDVSSYSIPRNTYLNLNVTVKDDNLIIDGEVLPWGDADGDYTFDGQHSLTVDKADFVFTADGTGQNINILTNYPTGWKIESIGYKSADTGWITTPATSTTGLANTTTTTSITLKPNTTSNVREGLFIIKAGNLQKTIRVTQLPAAANITDAVLPQSYVGAFWKANQTGERLIRIPRPTDASADGKWSATVIAGQDWIILDTQMTTDTNVGWRTDVTPTEANVQNGNDGSFDYMHAVSGNLTSVSGTLNATNSSIYFRIGLNSKYTATDIAPARYGVVLLAYNNNTKFQRIWIRQGQDPDYLMRPTDPSTGTYTNATRPNAVKFTAYNLTAKTLNAPVQNTYAASPSADPMAIFTDYPSQAGAMFQWAATTVNPNPRYAFPPIGTIPAASFGGGGNIYPSNWTTLAANNETCPRGYTLSTGATADFRRFNDGPIGTAGNMDTSALIAQSEMRTSLFSVPVSGNGSDWTQMRPNNSAFGYYADGFFDRRQIVSSSVGAAMSTVAASSPHDVAYRGSLLFNPNNNASIFFPAAGGRYRQPSSAYNTGGIGYYWSSSMQDATTNIILTFNAFSTYAYVDRTGGYDDAQSIRCVKAVINVLDYMTDPDFHAYGVSRMSTWDTNGDDILSPTEASNVAAIYMLDNYPNVKSLAGLEWFTGITQFTCYNGQLTSLDLSHSPLLNSVVCYGHKLTSLDVSKNIVLTKLYCYSNPGSAAKFIIKVWSGFNIATLPTFPQPGVDGSGYWTYNSARVDIQYQTVP